MRFPLSSPDSVSAAALEDAVACLRSGRHTMGPKVEAFEAAFASYVGAKHAVMVNSGSSANLLAVEALVRPSNHQPQWVRGDEILVPALSWSTTVWPLLQLGLRPVFVDVDPQTLAIDLDQAAAKVTARTRGLMLIHVLGLAANLDAVQRFCRRHALTLIEDCCEAFGAHWVGQHVGTYGKVSTFSHFFSHQLTTIEGGTIVTDDAALADDLRSMRAHGWSRNRSDRTEWERVTGLDPRFLFVSSGYNVRPMELQAAIGLHQLKDAHANIRHRNVTALEVRAACDGIAWIELIGFDAARILPKWGHSWMNAPLRLLPGAPSRAVVLRALDAAGIETRPILAGNITRHPAFSGMREAFPVADDVMANGFMIGCHDPAIAEPLADALKACVVAA